MLFFWGMQPKLPSLYIGIVRIAMIRDPNQYNGVVILGFELCSNETWRISDLNRNQKLYLPQSSKGVTSHHQKHTLRAEI